MNTHAAITPAASIGPGRKLKWLIKREWWEHKGSFFWAPLIAGAISLILTLLMLVITQILISKGEIINRNVEINNFKLGDLLQDKLGQMSPEDMRIYGEAVTSSLLLAGIWPVIIFGFAVFFYFLGALYDERRDRSILFWKSLPLSDTQTVLSKLITALVCAPLCASVIGLASGLGFGLLLSLFILVNGGDPFSLYWAYLAPQQLLLGVFGWIPVYILWALPTVGWLLLCSAWARSAPFLWSLLVPILSGIAVSMFSTLGYSSTPFWQHVVLRLLGSAWPGSHMLGLAQSPLTGDIYSLWSGTQMFARPALWIGVAAGIGMIALAIRLRRWRAEA